MANVKTYNLSVYFVDSTTVTFRGISRVAVERYKKYYLNKYIKPDFFVAARYLSSVGRMLRRRTANP